MVGEKKAQLNMNLVPSFRRFYIRRKFAKSAKPIPPIKDIHHFRFVYSQKGKRKIVDIAPSSSKIPFKRTTLISVRPPPNCKLILADRNEKNWKKRSVSCVRTWPKAFGLNIPNLMEESEPEEEPDSPKHPSPPTTPDCEDWKQII